MHKKITPAAILNAGPGHLRKANIMWYLDLQNQK